jgi:hypothetical protein
LGQGGEAGEVELSGFGEVVVDEPAVAVLVRVEADGREDAVAVQDAEMTRAAVATAELTCVTATPRSRRSARGDVREVSPLEREGRG